MAGDLIVIEGNDGFVKLHRARLGTTAGRNEAWLRDFLYNCPDTIPIAHIDPAFDGLIPLAREVMTDAGPADIIFINKQGFLTIVECKLWRNPEARRKVVAQILDYARHIAHWTYSDLQSRISSALKMKGNVVFDLVKAAHPETEESWFVDAVSRSMKAGRFLLLIAGDGIHEDVKALADMVNRNSALGFSLGMFETAIFEYGDKVIVQPRAILRTALIERTFVSIDREFDSNIEEVEPTSECISNIDHGKGTRAGLNEQMRQWWAPIEPITFDDPDQSPARYTYPNSLYAPLPWKGAWLTAYREKRAGGRCGIFLGGRKTTLPELTELLLKRQVLNDLPSDVTFSKEQGGISIKRNESDFMSTADEQRWLAGTMSVFMNAILPRIKSLIRERKNLMEA